MSLKEPAAVLGAPGHGRVAGVAKQYLTFILAERSFALHLEEIAEITSNLPLNRMPHMPKSVEGLLNLRGEVLPVINLRVRFGLPQQELSLFKNILIVDMAGHRVGLLVDCVETVVTDPGDRFTPASPLLAGIEGALTQGFLVVEQRIIAVLDTRQITSTSHSGAVEAKLHSVTDVEQRLDESLKHLIDMAPKKAETDHAAIIPQVETAISHTEAEMGKVLERVEMMLVGADKAFQGLARLKQEASMGRLKGHEAEIAEIDKVGQQLQDELFELIQQIQYQDIVRQKLERVLNHIRGLQGVIGSKFKDMHA